MSEDDKREGAGEGLFVPPKIEPEGGKGEDDGAGSPTTSSTSTSTSTTTSTSLGDGEEGSRRRRRRRPEGDAVKAELVKSDSADSEAKPTVAQMLAKAKGNKPAASKPVVSTQSEGEGATAETDDAPAGGDRMDLPKWNRAKVKRKQVAGPEQPDDAFQAGVRKAGRQAVKRAPIVFGGIVLVAATIAGVVWYRGHVAEQDAEATRILAQAAAVQARGEVKPPGFTNDRKLPFPIPLLDEEAERAQQVDKELGALHSAAEGSEADLVADLMRAAQLVKDGKFGDAITTYSAFLDKNPKHELAFLAREGKALALEANGDVDGAIGELDTLAGNKGDFYRDQALAQKGRILEANGRKDEALVVYETYVEEYPLDQDSIAKPEVVARLKELKPELVPAEPETPGGLGDFQLPPGFAR